MLDEKAVSYLKGTKVYKKGENYIVSLKHNLSETNFPIVITNSKKKADYLADIILRHITKLVEEL